MALGPRLDLRQSQSLVMTPQLQQAIRLLAASNLEIETFIGEALEANPLLEAGEMRVEDREPAPESAEADIHDATPDFDGGGDGDQALDIDSGVLDRDRDTGDGDWGAGGAHVSVADELPAIGERNSSECTLAEHLEEQIGPIAFSDREAFIARHIVGQLDEAGYLTVGLRDIADILGATADEVEDALELVQSLDPTGVGARSLSECLALQAKEANRYDPCMARLIDNLELVARGEFARLKRMCNVDDEDFADMLAELRGYNPKPGLAFDNDAANAVVPDILLARGKDGAWDIQLNEATLPRLVVNRAYYLELRDGAPGKEAQGWLKEKLADANWLIKALDQRAKTILKTAAEIVKRQEGFFRRGVSELKPLTLREVAEAIDMHESTVSRVTSNKYLHCERGCFELKYFFSSGVGRTGEGAEGEGASAEAVKARIKALIDGEDCKKILSDQALVDMLKAEGFDLARRTVAKYREAIGIGSSAQRRRQKKLQAF